MMQIHLLHLGSESRGEIAGRLGEAGFDVRPYGCPEEFTSALGAQPGAVAVVDLALPDVHDGLELLAHCHSMAPNTPFVVLSDRNDAAVAIDAIRKGAVDVLTPETIGRLEIVCRRAARSLELADQARARRGEDPDDEGDSRRACVPGRAIRDVLRGNHVCVRRMRQELLRLTHVDTAVLVKAETGCGKEVVARCLHDFGPRAGKPFVAINCGAIPENIFESELFGHEAGAFTGANKRRIGKLEYAAGGTIFLDEIESMPLAMQVKLLRALQQRTIERVGGNQPIKLSCRVVAASKDDLLELSRRGGFRMDLYYRLSVIELELPPLRDRREDIPELAESFAREAAEHHGLPYAPLDTEFVFDLMAQEWPGNVRELRNAVERRVLGVRRYDADDSRQPRSLAQQVAAYERAIIERSLQVCSGSVTRVAEILDVPRKTLYDKLTRFCVDPSTFRHADAALMRH